MGHLAISRCGDPKDVGRGKDQSRTGGTVQRWREAERTVYPPPVVRLCFRVILFVPCSAFAVVGDDVSDVCFRLSEALDIEGVVLGPEGPGAPPAPDGVGTALDPDPG